MEMIRKISFFMLGMMIGVFICYLYFNYNLVQKALDINRDGKSDIQYLFRPNQMLKQMRIDRNHDEIDDTLIEYDRYGVPVVEHSDDNFDGVYDTDIEYKWGLISRIKIDTNQDGEHEIYLVYRYGVLESIVYLGKDGQEESRDNLSKLKIQSEE